MRILSIASITVIAALGSGVWAQAQSQSQSQSQGQTSQQDTQFITQAAEGNLAEVQLGKLGAQKSQNSQIRQFSKHLETDHQSANQKLQSIAQSKGVQFPQNVGSQQQQELSQLQGLSGAQFDRQFATIALKDHAKTLELYQKQAQQAQDPAVKQYAQTMVPALEQHLSMAKDMARDVGLSQTTISSILSQYPAAIGGATSPSGQQQGTGSSQSGQEGSSHKHKHHLSE